MIRAALYLRVSREDLAIDNQRPDLEALCARQGFSVVKVYEEQESAAAARRPVREEMLSDAHKGRFDILVVWALDRLGRSMHGNIQDVLRLDRAGVRIASSQEPWLDTRGPVRELLVAIFSWVAEQERSRMIERTKAGLERARAAGKKIGRPVRVTPALQAEIAWRAADDWTIREISMALKLPKATVYRAVRALQLTPTAVDVATNRRVPVGSDFALSYPPVAVPQGGSPKPPSQVIGITSTSTDPADPPPSGRF